jgi:hypothetical protein
VVAGNQITARPAGLLRRAILALVAALLCGQILAIHVADYYVGRAETGSIAALETALWWDEAHPVALARLGLAARRQDNTDAAENYLRRAVGSDPANARPQADLALSRINQNDTLGGDRLAEAAHRLMPVQYAVQRDLAMYWFSRQQIERAVQHLAVALVGGRAELRDQFFPVLLNMAADEQARTALAPIALNPQPYGWWAAFFRYATINATNVDTLTALVAMREASSTVPLDENERNQYINRLRKEGLIAEAYLYWVNGLSKEELQFLGYLFDGGFERDFANNAGFGWSARPPVNSGIRITAGETYGIAGEQALRLSFRGERVRFRHLWQNLFLAPGTYTLSGRARPDKLKARRGLQWRVSCNAGATGTLGQSEELLGAGDWRSFEFDIIVPPDCAGQVLRLNSVGNRDVDHELSGSIWFDAMRLELKR